jgi:hypothetical protein
MAIPKRETYSKLIAQGFSIPVDGDAYHVVENSIATDNINQSVAFGPLTTVFKVEILNDETAAGRDMTVSFNAAGNKETTIKAGESTTFKLAKITSIYIGNGSGNTVNYRIRMYGTTG